jgi:hypothetical protein
MNDGIRFANKIRQALNESARLDGPRGGAIAERLRAARERALDAKAPERAPAFSWARLQASGALGGFGGFALRVLLPALLLIAGLVAIYGWQQEQRAADAEELDAQLLTDVLPIDAYLDRGFEAWLKKASADR